MSLPTSAVSHPGLPATERAAVAGCSRLRELVATVLIAVVGVVALVAAIAVLSEVDCRRGAVSYFHTAQPCTKLSEHEGASSSSIAG